MFDHADGERIEREDVTPQDLFDMMVSVSMRLERAEVAVTQTCAVLLAHLEVIDSPDDDVYASTLDNLRAYNHEIADIRLKTEAVRRAMEFLDSPE